VNFTKVPAVDLLKVDATFLDRLGRVGNPQAGGDSGIGERRQPGLPYLCRATGLRPNRLFGEKQSFGY
jgi:hypothetical protein